MAKPPACLCPSPPAGDIIFLLYAIAKINRHIELLSKSQKPNIPKQSKERQITAVFVLAPGALN